jgi:hypothetical protein
MIRTQAEKTEGEKKPAEAGGLSGAGYINVQAILFAALMNPAYVLYVLLSILNTGFLSPFITCQSVRGTSYPAICKTSRTFAKWLNWALVILISF